MYPEELDKARSSEIYVLDGTEVAPECTGEVEARRIGRLLRPLRQKVDILPCQVQGAVIDLQAALEVRLRRLSWSPGPMRGPGNSVHGEQTSGVIRLAEPFPAESIVFICAPDSSVMLFWAERTTDAALRMAALLHRDRVVVEFPMSISWNPFPDRASAATWSVPARPCTSGKPVYRN